MARKRVEAQGRKAPYLGWKQVRDRTKINLSVPTEVAERLASYAGHLRVNPGDVVAQAVMIETRGFVCYLPSESPSTHEAAKAPGSPPEASPASQAIRIA